MNISMRLTTVVLAVLVSTLGIASLAFAQDPAECYPVPVEECPTGGVLPDAGSDDDDDGTDGGDAPAVTVGAAGEDPVVLAQTELAQTGIEAATLFAVVGLTLGSGLVLLLTTRRRRS